MSGGDAPRPPSFRSTPRRVGEMGGELEVHVADEQATVAVDVQRLAGLVRCALAAEGVRGDVEVGVLIVDEPTIADLNQRHMNEQGPTDVLAFPIDDEYVVTGRSPEGGSRGPTTREPLTNPGPLLLGDIVLCPAWAGRNAAANAGSYPGHRGDLADELDLLAVHGVLHLLGFDHATAAERSVMQARERELLAACRPQRPPPLLPG